MPPNTSPIHPVTPLAPSVNISAASAIRTTTGVTGLVLVHTAGNTASDYGDRIDIVNVKATGTTTAGMVRFWIYSGSGNASLIKEQLVTAITPSATLAAFEVDVVFPQLILPKGYSLYATTEKAESFNITAFGGKF